MADKDSTVKTPGKDSMHSSINLGPDASSNVMPAPDSPHQRPPSPPIPPSRARSSTTGAMLMTPSMTNILDDVLSAPTSDVNINVNVESEENFLRNTIAITKGSSSQDKIVAEMRRLYDLYQQSQVQNMILAKQNKAYLDKLKAFEERQWKDPRVMKALEMADRHRNFRKDADQERDDLRGQLFEANRELKHKDVLLRKHSKDISQLQDSLKKLKSLESHVEIVEDKLMKKGTELQLLQDLHHTETNKWKQQKHELVAQARQQSMDEHTRQNLALDKDMHRLELITTNEKSLVKELEDKQKQINYLQTDNSANHHKMDEYKEKNAILLNKNVNMQTLLDQLESRSHQVAKELSLFRVLCKKLKGDLTKLREDHQDQGRVCLQLKFQLTFLTEQKQTVSTRLREAQKKIQNLTYNLHLCREYSSVMEHEIKLKDKDLITMHRQKRSQSMNLASTTAKCTELTSKKDKLSQALKTSENEAMSLVNAIKDLQDELQKQKNVTKVVELEKSRNYIEKCMVHNHCLDLLDRNQVLRREAEIANNFVLRLENRQGETDRQVQTLVKSNIELYTDAVKVKEASQLQTQQFRTKDKEIRSLQCMFKTAHDQLVTRELSSTGKLMEIEQLTRELARLTEIQERQKHQSNMLAHEHRRMSKNLNNARDDVNSYQRILETLRTQRDMLGSQLLQTKTELQASQMRMKKAEEIIKKGHMEVVQLNADIYVLKLEIKNMRRQRAAKNVKDNMITTLRTELAKTDKKLELERAKNTALVNTRQPIIHRWRGLLAADPSKFELYEKIGFLTRRLIQKTTEVVEKEQLLRQKNTYYMQLQTLVVRRSVPAVTAEITTAKNIISSQQRKMKALTAELNMNLYDQSVKEAKIAEQRGELHEAKKKIVDEQRGKRRLMKNAKLPPIGCKRNLSTQVQVTQGLGEQAKQRT